MRKKTIGNATLYQGDCLDLMRSLKVAVDALITDPPYSSGGMVRGDRALPTTTAKYVGSGVAKQHADFTGDNRDARSWTFWSILWLSLAQKLMRPGAYALCFSDWRQLPTLTDIFQAGGLVWRGLVPWDKTTGRAPHTGYFRHQCEYVVWGSNGPFIGNHAKHGGPWPGLVREVVKPSEKLHMTGKPIRLMEELVQCVPPGGLILDPFMGSGSTAIAAIRSGRRFVGIEMSAHYFEVACERIEREVRGGLLAKAA